MTSTATREGAVDRGKDVSARVTIPLAARRRETISSARRSWRSGEEVDALLW